MVRVDVRHEDLVLVSTFDTCVPTWRAGWTWRFARRSGIVSIPNDLRV